MIRADGEAGQVRDEDGAERAIRHDRELRDGETVKLKLGEDDSVIRVLDVPK